MTADHRHSLQCLRTPRSSVRYPTAAFRGNQPSDPAPCQSIYVSPCCMQQRFNHHRISKTKCTILHDFVTELSSNLALLVKEHASGKGQQKVVHQQGVTNASEGAEQASSDRAAGQGNGVACASTRWNALQHQLRSAKSRHGWR